MRLGKRIFDKRESLPDANSRSLKIVCTPEDAFRCFMGNELDVLVVGHCPAQEIRAG